MGNLQFLAYAHISTHISTTYKIGQAIILLNKENNSAIANLLATTSRNASKVRDENNSVEIALHNSEVYQKERLRDQQTVGPLSTFN